MLASLVAAAVATAAAAPAAAQIPSDSGGASSDPAGTATEALVVRVVARPIADGRIEMALQRFDPAGRWGPRLLPESRFLPVRATPGRWLASSTLTLERPTGSTIDVRIVARRLADGRSEFGLQRRSHGSNWGRRLLGNRRIVPAEAAPDRWLAGSPQQPGVDELSPVDVPDSATTEPPGDPQRHEQLAELLLTRVNSLRSGVELAQLEPSVELAEVVTEWADAMAEESDWLDGYAFTGALAPYWDNWRVVASAYVTAPLNEDRLVERMAEILLDDDYHDSLLCDICSHMGVGVAYDSGRTYASVVLAGQAPSERRIAAVEADMVDHVNRLRADLGLGALRQNDGLAQVARNWSAVMGESGDFRHNPNADDEAPAGWRRLAENIAYIGSPASLGQATTTAFENLVDSPDHYANLTNPKLTHIGVGMVVDNAALWVTQLFATYR